MTKEMINIGLVENNGTGNTLRETGDKINRNFDKIFTHFGDGAELYPLSLENAQGAMAPVAEPWVGDVDAPLDAATIIETGVDLDTVQRLTFHFRSASSGGVWPVLASIDVADIVRDDDQGALLHWHNDMFLRLRLNEADVPNGRLTIRSSGIVLKITKIEFHAPVHMRIKERIDISNLTNVQLTGTYSNIGDPNLGLTTIADGDLVFLTYGSGTRVQGVFLDDVATTTLANGATLEVQMLPDGQLQARLEGGAPFDIIAASVIRTTTTAGGVVGPAGVDAPIITASDLPVKTTLGDGDLIRFFDSEDGMIEKAISLGDFMAMLTTSASPNIAPVAVDDNATTDAGVPVSIRILDNDTDADNDTLSVTQASSPDGAVLVNADNTITFTPRADFTGATVVNYTISDGRGGADDGQVAVAVNETADDIDNAILSFNVSDAEITLTSSDDAADVTIEVTAPDHLAAQVTFAIELLDAGPINLVPAQFSGAAETGQAQTGLSGLWVSDQSAGAVTVTRQWLRNGNEIPNATALVYTPVAQDAGTELSLIETATDTHGSRSVTTATVSIADTATPPIDVTA